LIVDNFNPAPEFWGGIFYVKVIHTNKNRVNFAKNKYRKYTVFIMDFEFYINKSRNNKQKHGIDFHDAKRLWDDENRLVIPAKKMDELRFLLIGQINYKLYSAIYTLRSDIIRIISVRRSRKEERIIYEGK